MNDALIDTSAWIDFFRNKDGLLGDIVTDLIRHDKAYLTGPVIAELLHGVRDKKENAQLGVLFETIPCLAVTNNNWVECGRLLFKLRKKGITVPLTDALIAVVASQNNKAVLTLDKHFHSLPAACIKI